MELRSTKLTFSTPFFEGGRGVESDREYRSCGPNCPPRTGRLLDLPVRTDTSKAVPGTETGMTQHANVGGFFSVSGGCGGCGDPVHLVRCDSCGLPLAQCRCVSGWDY